MLLRETLFMKNKPSLITLLLKVNDNRQAGGKRHELIHILLIVIMGTMIGYEGYRGIEAFVKRFEADIICLLKIPRKEVSSMSTVRRVMMSLDFNQLSGVFYQWTKKRVVIRRREWFSCDGKGMKDSLTNHNTKYQNFVSIVSVYCNRAGLVIQTKAMNNKERSEAELLREPIEALDITGIVLSADALHCQKKHYPSLSVNEIII
jgi:hypothetical protein